jgi:hypothetical protein
MTGQTCGVRSPAPPASCASLQVIIAPFIIMIAFGFLIVKPGQMLQGVSGQGKIGGGLTFGGGTLPFPCKKKKMIKKGARVELQSRIIVGECMRPILDTHLSFTLAFTLAFALSFALAFTLAFALSFALAFALAFALSFALAFALSFALSFALAFTLSFALSFALALLRNREIAKVR